MRQDVFLLPRSAHPSQRSTTPFSSAPDSASRRIGFEHFGLVALRQPYDLPRRGGRQQTHAQFIARFRTEAFDQSQTAAYPALVPPQQLRHFHLAHAVFAHQRLNDPCFFQFARAPSGAIETVDGGFRRPLVGFHEPG